MTHISNYNNSVQGLAESVADLLMTISRSTNGSIIVQEPQNESVTLLKQFKALERNIKTIKSSNEVLEKNQKIIQRELNRTRNDLQAEINIVSVSKKKYNFFHSI